MKHRLSFKNLLKWLWIFSVLAFVFNYIIKNRETLQVSLSNLSWTALLLSLAVILIAKFLLTANMWFALKKVGYVTSYRYCFYTYNLTQLAKYIPGSIWQFVGRIAMLKEKGVSVPQIRDSILAEHLWILFSSFIVGLLCIVTTGDYLLVLNINNRYIELAFIAIGLGFFVLLILIFIPLGQRLFNWILKLRPGVSEILNLVLVWVMLGLAFWIVLFDFQLRPVSLFYVIGLYSIAYLIGFLVPFAPAGFGFRETVLVFGLAHLVGVETAVILAGVNRVLYFLSELLIGFFLFSIRRFFKGYYVKI